MKFYEGESHKQILKVIYQICKKNNRPVNRIPIHGKETDISCFTQKCRFNKKFFI